MDLEQHHEIQRRQVRNLFAWGAVVSLLFHGVLFAVARNIHIPPGPLDQPVFVVALDTKKPIAPPKRPQTQPTKPTSTQPAPRVRTRRTRHIARPQRNPVRRYKPIEAPRRPERPRYTARPPIQPNFNPNPMPITRPTRPRERDMEVATLPSSSEPSPSGSSRRSGPNRRRSNDAPAFGGSQPTGGRMHPTGDPNRASGQPNLRGASGDGDNRSSSGTPDGAPRSDGPVGNGPRRMAMNFGDGDRPSRSTPASDDQNPATPDSDPAGDTPRSTRRNRARDTKSSPAFEVPTPIPAPTATPRPAPKPEESLKPKADDAPRPDRVDNTFHRAQVRSAPHPSYPSDAKANNQEGKVTLRLEISADGDVTDVSVTGSSGVGSLDEAAARGARRWKYTPARRGKKAVSSSVTAVVRWRLED